ncbi:MAG: calcium/proton exchanger [Chloroflexota bacterium]|nr:calcium/proton exchanger [Chloroflexota bacterium]
MKYLMPLLLLVPITFFLEWTHTGGETAVFAASSLALIPLAGLLGKATEEAAHYTGPKIGSLLNATLGNAAELIITIMALRAGLFTVVKASIAGSIVGNILVVLGASLLLGGLKHGTQTFDARSAGANATMMILAVVALTMPAVFAHGSVEGQPTDPEHIQLISDWMAVVLIIIYVLYIFYTLTAEPTAAHDAPHPGKPGMSLPVAIGLMAASTIGVVFMSEVLVGSIEPVAEAWGLSELFIGVMLVPLVGNIAEHIVAVQMAYQNKMDLSLGIAVGSGLQIALFVTPVLIGVSVLLGTPMTLVFNQYELAALVGASLIAAMISVDGESNWLEGAQLLGLYLMLGIAFFFL